jgi:hypothetical protein
VDAFEDHNQDERDEGVTKATRTALTTAEIGSKPSRVG